MKEKRKQWQELILRCLAILIILAIPIFVIMLKKMGDYSVSARNNRWMLVILVLVIIIVGRYILKNIRWLAKHHQNADYLSPIIPGGFKGFHRKNLDEVIEMLDAAYNNYYKNAVIYSVKKVVLWRQKTPKQGPRSPKVITVNMLNANDSYEKVRLRHVTLAVEVKYQLAGQNNPKTDYYYYFNGNLFVSSKKSEFLLPAGWEIKDDILKQLAEEDLLRQEAETEFQNGLSQDELSMLRIGEIIPRFKT
ncbi:MAG: hypothetical protein NTX66_03375 [Candidatus Falkowbacteria bacterium]|nr:hypothetical protein [Candidatus Falkowbacteria bacterium]